MVSRRTPRLVATLLAAAVLAGCSAARNPSLTPELAGWATGPVSWLLLPEEGRRFGALRSDAQARAFIRDFWRRRGASGAALPGGEPPPDDEFARTFFARVEMADRLYGEDSVRGALTDRGGALLLLGPPPIVRVSRRPTAQPTAHPSGAAPPARGDIQVEVWGYAPAELPPRLLALEPRLRRQGEIDLTFVAGARRVTLAEGRELLRLAARALAGRSPEDR